VDARHYDVRRRRLPGERRGDVGVAVAVEPLVALPAVGVDDRAVGVVAEAEVVQLLLRRVGDVLETDAADLFLRLLQQGCQVTPVEDDG
jgi:hypothetical protein